MLRRIVNSISSWLASHVPAQHGGRLWAFLAGCLVLCILLFFVLQQLKPRGRRALIAAVTFLAGLFYALEFFLPTTIVNGQEENALTPLLPVASDFSQIIATFALGLGVYTLCSLH